MPVLGALKSVLGDGTFGKYFVDSNNGSETWLVSTIELLHYINILLEDHHLSNQDAYRDETQSYIYSLLRRFTIPPRLRCGAMLLL
jgi:hypothetical protein